MAEPDPDRLITQLELSVHTYWRLYKADLFTVAKVVDRTPEELLTLFGSERRYLDELRRALLAAGYTDPWPELDEAPELAPSPRIESLGLRADIEKALIANRRRTLARVLGTPADDLLAFLSWEQFDELQRRLLELGHIERGNIERG